MYIIIYFLRFNNEKATRHLATTELLLIKPNSLGLKTLEPHASEYLDFYDNSVRNLFLLNFFLIIK